MDRIKINCEIAGNQSEVQLDIKKIPGEKGPCYMVSVDGLFKGYLKKESTGMYSAFMSIPFSTIDLDVVNEVLQSKLI